jgi:hypothetical protein
MRLNQFANNENDINQITSKILLYTIIAYPIILSLVYLKVFHLNIVSFLIASSISIVLQITPRFLLWKNMYNYHLKYIIIIIITIIAGILQSIHGIELSIIIFSPILIAGFYINPKVIKMSFLFTMINICFSSFIGKNYLGNSHYWTFVFSYTIQAGLFSFIVYQFVCKIEGIITNTQNSEQALFEMLEDIKQKNESIKISSDEILNLSQSITSVSIASKSKATSVGDSIEVVANNISTNSQNLTET